MWISEIKNKKQKGEKILMVTAYDASQSRLLSETEVDLLLVGDSVAMAVHGFESTLYADMDMMTLHTASVVRGLQENQRGPKTQKHVVSDMPFLTVRKGLRFAMDCVEKLMRAGAQSVKIEGCAGNEEIISHIVKSGVPVMGHLGLTPQSVHQLGGYKVQAKAEADKEKLLVESAQLEELGCYALVLECVPTSLSKKVTEKLEIPTIGIGAGPVTDGQVLVYHDLLGISQGFKAKFLRKYLEGARDQVAAISQFCVDVKNGSFPSDEESYNL